MLTTTPTLSSWLLANATASPMPSRSDHDAKKRKSTPGTPLKRPRTTKAVRGKSPTQTQECVRALHVVQRLLARDMRMKNLSLRKAARDGHISVGTLSSVLDGRRVADPAKHPKRGAHRGTLLHLRAIPWIGRLTSRTLDRVIVATGRRS